MKHFNTIFFLVGIVYSTVVMQSCVADVDLNNIDTTASVKATLATPIGSIKASIGDFFGDGEFGIYVNQNHVLTFRDTFSITRKFHNVDLKQSFSDKTIPMDVYEKLSNNSLLSDGKITGNSNIQIPLTFPFTLELDSINHDENHQRLDSALIRNARFVSRISLNGGLPLEWEWIDKVTLTLGETFSRPQGNTLTIYTRGDGYGFDQDIEINVDQFIINLMKNKNLNPEKDQDKYSGNVINTCDMTITMFVTVPSSAGQILIPSTAGFKYYVAVEFIDYEAIWGMFKPSSDMSGADEISIAEMWSGWDSFKQMRLPFADPSVDLYITTQIAGAMELTGDYLYVSDNQGKSVYATFDDKDSKLFYKPFRPDEYLPLTSAIGDSTTVHVVFDKDVYRGQIDRLFTIHPENIGYKFLIDFNRQKTPQIRITDNTDLKIDAVCNLPLQFNQGVSLAYSDTIRDLDLSGLSVDSLLGSIEVIDTLEKAILTLALKIENAIPLQFKGEFSFLDENGEVLLHADSIVIPAPKHEFDANNNHWNATSETYAELITIDKENAETLSKVRDIAFNISMDDESLQYIYEQDTQGEFNVELTEYETLQITIGVGADMEAILNLNTVNNQ